MKPGGGKIWFTAAELADLGLPGLSRAKRKVNERAADDGWALATDAAGAPLARPRQGRGGGLEYHVDLLPAAARAELAARGVSVVADVTATPAELSGADEAAIRVRQMWSWYDAQSAKAKAEAERRAAAIGAVDAYVAAGMTISAAVPMVADQRGVGASTLWGWFSLIDGIAAADRLPFLAPRRAGGGATAEIDPEAWQLLLSDYLRNSKPTFSACYWRLARGFAAERGLVLPPERTLRRKLEREVDGRLIIASREGAEALRRTLPAQQRSVASLTAMEAVNIDGHRFDVFVRWPDGRVGRATMLAIQDIYSRKILAWRVGETESALQTRLTFADLFARWGIPANCLLDNGRAFASKWISGGAKTRFRFKIKDDEPTGVLTALGVAIHWATPYRGQSKPIERAFRDLCDTIARHPAFEGAYTGNTPLAKPENYGKRAIDIDLFRAIVDEEIAAHNARPGRRTETARGRSFDDAFAESYAAAAIGKATPEQLRLALLTAEDRPCSRTDSVITLEGNRYWAPELADHAGKRLTIRFDPDNLHGEIHAYTRGGEFIATCPVMEAAGFFTKADAGKRRAEEADLRRRVREMGESHRLLDAKRVAELSRFTTPVDPETTPGAIRPIRHRGQTAAALKPLSQTASIVTANPDQTAVMDRLARGVRKLRAVK